MIGPVAAPEEISGGERTLEKNLEREYVHGSHPGRRTDLLRWKLGLGLEALPSSGTEGAKVTHIYVCLMMMIMNP